MTRFHLPAVGQPFATDLAGRPAPNPQIQREADAYNAAHGLPPINHNEYIDVEPTHARRIADAYDVLPTDDRTNPVVHRAYEAFAREVSEQWDFAVASGMTFEPDPDGKDPYATSFEVASDIRHNRHLYFYQGGEPHRFLSVLDPSTGYSINDKFRAIHDYFGHCASGYGFGPRGEENAWNAHSQMFSWEARRALTTETRGQNSWVNFGQHNYDEDGQYLNIPPAERPYAPQKTALLPDEFVHRPSPTQHPASIGTRRRTSRRGLRTNNTRTSRRQVARALRRLDRPRGRQGRAQRVRGRLAPRGSAAERRF